MTPHARSAANLLDSARELLTEGDVWFLLAAIALLWWLGDRAIAEDPRARAHGHRAGLVALVAFVSHRVTRLGLPDAEFLATTLFRGLLAAGLAVPATWILLVLLGPILRWLVRLATAPFRFVQQRWRVLRSWCRERGDRRHRAVLERERDRRVTTSRQRSEQTRRADARAALLRAHAWHAPRLGDRFPRATLDEYVRDFLGDDHPPEDVERRAAELTTLLKEQAAAADPPPAMTSLADLAGWFEQQRAQIDALPVDETIRDVHRAQLQARYAELSAELLEEMQP